MILDNVLDRWAEWIGPWETAPLPDTIEPGATVIYVSPHNPMQNEVGRVSSVSGERIWVRYTPEGETGQLTPREDLVLGVRSTRT